MKSTDSCSDERSNLSRTYLTSNPQSGFISKKRLVNSSPHKGYISFLLTRPPSTQIYRDKRKCLEHQHGRRIIVFTLGTRGFSRVRREFSVLAEGRHVFGRRRGSL